MTVVDLWYSCGIQSTIGTVVWISRIDFHSGVRWWILSALLWRTPCFGPTISCSLYRGCCIRSLAYLQRSSVVAKEQTHVSWCQHGMLPRHAADSVTGLYKRKGKTEILQPTGLRSEDKRHAPRGSCKLQNQHWN